MKRLHSKPFAARSQALLLACAAVGGLASATEVQAAGSDLLFDASAAALLAANDDSSGTTNNTPMGSDSFDRYDKNGDGYLTMDEVKANASMKKSFGDIDTNHDNKISREEFNAAGARRGALDPQQPPTHPTTDSTVPMNR